MIMRETQRHSITGRITAIVLSLIFVLTVFTPLYVGTSNANAATGVKLKQPGDSTTPAYFFYIENAPQKFRDAVRKAMPDANNTSDNYGVRYVEYDSSIIEGAGVAYGKTVAEGTLSKAANNPFGSNSSTWDYIYGCNYNTDKTGIDHISTTADALEIRDFTTLPRMLGMYSVKGAIRLYFNANKVDNLEDVGDIKFLEAPTMTAMDSNGNPVPITYYDLSGSSVAKEATANEVKLNKVTCEDTSLDYYYFIDLKADTDENGNLVLPSNIDSLTFSAEKSQKWQNGDKDEPTGDTQENKTVSTQPLAPIVYGNYIYFEGAIPRDPHIFTFDASDPAFTNDHQNYFMINEDSSMTVSKYEYPNRLDCEEHLSHQTIWVYNELWANNKEIYATGDYNDFVREVFTLTEDANNPGWFSGKLAMGAEYRFHPQENDDELGASDYTYIPSGGGTGNKETALYGDNTAYYMSQTYTDQWVDKSNVKSNYDFRTTGHNNNGNSNIYWMDATYYDYLSEDEKGSTVNDASKWRSVNAGLHEQKTAENWSDNSDSNSQFRQYLARYNDFQSFNEAIYTVASKDTSWRYPMYFGNYFQSGDQNYTNESNINNDDAIGGRVDYREIKGNFLKKYFPNYSTDSTQQKLAYAANNSNGLGTDGAAPADDTGYSRSVLGLVYPELTKNFYGSESGSDFDYNMYVGNNGTTKSPYFDYEWLSGQKSVSGSGTVTPTPAETYVIKKTNYRTGTVDGASCRYYQLEIPSKITKILISDSNGNGPSETITLSDYDGVCIGYYYDGSNKSVYKSSNQDYAAFTEKNTNKYGDYWYVCIVEQDKGGNGNIQVQLQARDGKTWLTPSFKVETASLNSTVTVTDNTTPSGGSGSYTDTGRKAWVVQSQFPFREVNGGTYTGTDGEQHDITRYEFDSSAGDVVNFTWGSNTLSTTGTSANANVPTKVNYYKNTNTINNIKDFGNTVHEWSDEAKPGFFPFNNGSGTTGRDPSHGYNFGFATKMEMNFKLPANGTFGSGATGKHATFNFTGDDDLWVFIDGQLVLDLGGAHKKAEGSIDFAGGTTPQKNIIQSKANAVSAALNGVTSYETSERLYEFVIDPEDMTYTEIGDDGISSQKDSTFKFNNNLGEGFEETSEYKWSDINGKVMNLNSKTLESNYKANNKQYMSQIGSDGKYHIYAHQKENTGWADCAMQINNNEIFTEPTKTYVVNASNTTDSWRNGSSVPQNFYINNTDESMVHTMTIYYMERGMGQSNLKIDFNTLPANTNVRVSKEVDTSNINDGFRVTSSRGVITDYGTDADSFAYNIFNGGSTNIKNAVDNPDSPASTVQTNGKQYTLVDQNKDTSQTKTISATTGTRYSGKDSGFYLSDNQYARFDNTFSANQYVGVKETADSETSSGSRINAFDYTAYARLSDAAGNLIRANVRWGKQNSESKAQPVSEVQNKSEFEKTLGKGYYWFADDNRGVSFKLDEYPQNEGGTDVVTTGEKLSSISAYLQYINHMDTTDLVISTDIVDDEFNKVNLNSRRFTYKLEVYIENQWRTFPLDATVYLYSLQDDGGDITLKPSMDDTGKVSYETTLSSNGEFSISKYNKIIIHDLPTNLPYRITEERDSQFAAIGYYVNNTIDTLTKGNVNPLEDSTAPDGYFQKFASTTGSDTKTYSTNKDANDKQYASSDFKNLGKLNCMGTGDGVFVLKSNVANERTDPETLDPDTALEKDPDAANILGAKKTNSIQILNKFNPVPGALRVAKFIGATAAEPVKNQQQNFTFNAKLVDAAYEDGGNWTEYGGSGQQTVDSCVVALTSVDAQNNAQGIADFNLGTFSYPGIFIYELRESAIDESVKPLYKVNEQVFYAVVNVTSDGDNLAVDVNYYTTWDQDATRDLKEARVGGNNLDVAKCGLQTSIKDTTYGYSVSGIAPALVVDGDDSGDFIPKFVNILEDTSVDVQFKKVDSTDQTKNLAGAQFDLYETEDGAKNKAPSPAQSATSKADGTVKFEKLKYEMSGSSETINPGDTFTYSLYLTDSVLSQRVGSLNGFIQFSGLYVSGPSKDGFEPVAKIQGISFPAADRHRGVKTQSKYYDDTPGSEYYESAADKSEVINPGGRNTSLPCYGAFDGYAYSIIMDSNDPLTSADLDKPIVTITFEALKTFKVEDTPLLEEFSYDSSEDNPDISLDPDVENFGQIGHPYGIIEAMAAAGATQESSDNIATPGCANLKLATTGGSSASAPAKSYYFVESKAPTGYDLLPGVFRIDIYDGATPDDATYQILYNANPDDPSSKYEGTPNTFPFGNLSGGTVTIENNPSIRQVDIEFKKVDANTQNILNGAEFTLYTDDTYTTQAEKLNDDSTNADVAVSQSDRFINPAVSGTYYGEGDTASTAHDDGLVQFAQIDYTPSSEKADGTYDVAKTLYFKETKAAAGHELSPLNYYIDIYGNGTYDIGYIDATGKHKIDPESGVGGIYVKNNQSPFLPFSGGMGVALLYILGAAAVALAAAGYVAYKKREKIRAFVRDIFPPIN